MNKVILALVVLATGSLARAQVAPSQTGRELDANYQVGGMGNNSVRQNERLPDSNLYVTGQVTGMFRFHGNTGYAANDLRLNVPSADLDDFLRRSGGVPVPGGTFVPTYGPNSFYSIQRTVVGAAGINAGVNAPGTNMPRDTALPSRTATALYNQAMDAYKPITQDIGALLQVNVAAPPANAASNAPLTPTPAGNAPGATGVDQPSPYAQFIPGKPGSSTLFGVFRKEDDQLRLAKELTEAEKSRLDLNVAAKPIDARVPALSADGEPRAGLGAERPERANPNADLALTGAQGQDIFLDVLVNMRKARLLRAGEGAPNAAGPDRSGNQVADRTGNQTADRSAAPLPVEVLDSIVVVNSLGGKNKDTFNLYMSRGQKRLKAGDFYEASADFQTSASLNKGNPLAPLGVAVALFAAGEPLSAALNLRKAMTVFPPLMETRVNLQGGLLDRDLVTLRVAQLDERLASQQNQPDPSLVYLATFVRTCQGDYQQAQRLAQQLKAVAGDDKLYNAYADFVLTGRTPVATTRPTATTEPATRPGAAALPTP
jgi:tetratricopeptide (TPR) repeat protein